MIEGNPLLLVVLAEPGEAPTIPPGGPA